MFFSKKKHFVEEQMDKYFEALENCRDSFLGGLEHFLEVGKVDQQYLDFVSKTKKYEGIADDIRDTIEMRMYEEALIPESRGDVLAFLENLDFVPNNMESTMKFIDEVNLKIPAMEDSEIEDFKRRLKQLSSLVMDSLDLAIESGKYFFSEPRKVREYTVAIDRKESESDNIEDDLKRHLFRSDAFSDLQKTLFYNLIGRIAQVADLCEKFQRRIILLTFKNLY